MASGRTMAFPAPSLRELSRPTGVTEGVSSDGSTGPMVYPPAIINSETFYRLRSPGYTPSVSHSLDSSLREGAGRGLYHSSGCSLKSGVAGDFHRPYETQKFLHFTIHRGTLPQSRIRSTAPSGREPGVGLHHSTGYSLKSQVTGDFHRPYETLKLFTFRHSSKYLRRRKFCKKPPSPGWGLGGVGIRNWP